ncbi:MAG TPA: tRNA uracil 4-sulfurtransferase ThiI [Candidatus Acidoferrales bacterium]|nr:tRNA uracil 4-sulfurtransferase ThiI [Candidatus Acidoferrales bacterium]
MQSQESPGTQPVIVLHYHELWLKGRNKRYFLSKLGANLRAALEGISVQKIERPNDRFVIQLAPGISLDEVLRRIERLAGVAYYAVAHPVERELNAICDAAWQEMRDLPFASFAVRAKRSDKSFPHSSSEIERRVGRFLVDSLNVAGRSARVQLNNPDVTCRIEITSGPALVYARKIQGAGGMPANTAGKLMCLLSGGFDSAVAAYQMMKRGAHLAFVHFYGTGAQPGESSIQVARKLVAQLVPWQFTARLYRVPFEPIQREIVRYAPESSRVLLYRRMMLRIAEILARRNRALALVTGDSLAQVASQTLRNLVAVEAAARMPVFRPLLGADKLEILEIAKKIGTYDISAEPFHDCCPIFLPRNPELFSTPAALENAESNLDIAKLVQQGVESAMVENFQYRAGKVEITEKTPASKRKTAMA